MRINQIDLNLFVAFEVIYRERNLTKAGEILNISQPAVSNILRRMRIAFDDPLFVRTPHGMTPTPVANDLIGEVKEGLWRLNNAIVEREQFEPANTSQTFRLSMSHLASTLVLPQLMGKIRQAAPSIVLHVSRLESGIVQTLSTMELDLSVGPPVQLDPLLYHEPLLKDPYVCVMRQGHPGADGELSLDSYCSLFHIGIDEHGGQSDVDIALHGIGRRRKIRLHTDNYQAAFEIVKNTDLAMTLPSQLAKDSGLLLKDLPFEVPPMQLQLYWHKSVDTSPANRWIRQQVSACFRDLQASVRASRY